MEAYPMRLRERIMQLYDEGNQTHEVAEMLGTCRSGTRRIKQILRERKTLEPRCSKTGPKSGLTDERSRQLRELVAADPDATREERCELFGRTEFSATFQYDIHAVCGPIDIARFCKLRERDPLIANPNRRRALGNCLLLPPTLH